MTIQVYTRSVYGRSLVYVADSGMANCITTLTGSKTLEERHMTALEHMGFSFEQVQDPKLSLSR